MSDEQPKAKLHIEGDWKAEAQAEKDRLSQEGTRAAPELHVDSDWKAEAQAEKERLEKRESEKAKTRAERGARGLPEASFKSLVSVIASQAIMGLGAIQDPQTGGVVIDLESARFSIDLLAVLEEKTKGNLTKEEETELQQLTAELRSRFVHLSQMLAQQAASGTAPVTGSAPPPASP